MAATRNINKAHKRKNNLVFISTSPESIDQYYRSLKTKRAIRREIHSCFAMGLYSTG
jgi:hypothetical protein